MYKEMLTTLEEKVDPHWAALIVVDMQNDFCAFDGAFDQSGVDVSAHQAIAPAIVRLAAGARAAGVPVIFVKNVYNTRGGWYLSDVVLEQARRSFGGKYLSIPMCERDSFGGDFYGDVRPTDDDVVVIKHRFSAFINTDLDLILRSRQIRTVVLTGVATNICVESTAREAFFRDYYVVVAGDCVATWSPELHEASLKNIHYGFGEVRSSSELLATWGRPAEAVAPRSVEQALLAEVSRR
jgi:ureidoacrylate peracid hydrolase